MAIAHAPTLSRELARAQVGLGELVDAHENYNLIIRERIASGSPEPWVKALADAKAEIGPLTPHIRFRTITVAGPGPAHPKVTIDDAPINEAAFGLKRPTDPGRHELRAMANGYCSAKTTLMLKGGESINVAFELEVEPRDAAPKDEEESCKVSVANVVDPGCRNPVDIGAFAVGGAGSVTGFLATSKYDKLAAAWTRGVCKGPQKAAYDNHHTLGTVSTIGFVPGDVGAAAGVVLLLVKPQTRVQEQPSDQPVSTRPSFKSSPFVGIGRAGVGGTF